MSNGVAQLCCGGETLIRNGLVVGNDKIQRWFANGVLHREDGPAVEYADGTKFWYRDGKYHREDGPAIVWPSWYVHGERLGRGAEGFWNLWDRLTDEQRGSSTLLRYLPR